MAGTLWIDVGDLFDYTRANARPSGIQRVEFEISRTLHERCGGTSTARFVRYDPVRDSFRTVEWLEIAALFSRLTKAEPPSPGRRVPGRLAPHSGPRRFVRRLVYRLPESLRFHVTETLLAQERAFRAWASLFDALARGIILMLRRLARRRKRATVAMVEPSTSDIGTTGSFVDMAAPGDTLLTLGAPWSHPDYAGLIARHRDHMGLRYALVVYDIIPLRHPEWFDHGLVRVFHSFFNAVVPQCDTVLTISKATAADVTAYARERNMTLSGPVLPIPMGSGFSTAAPTATVVARTDRLPFSGSYVLFVSTIEARKNHLLMFRVWRRLLEELHEQVVPTLVFAGRVGWLVEDLMRQIANADFLDGKLVIVEDPTDAELTALYQGCLFTVFPSLYEGWGLPVTESLAFGKPCLIADRTSLPEAGGHLVRRFDPDNLNDALAAIRDVILNPSGLADWEGTVRRDFRPVPWTACVEALLAALGCAVSPAREVGQNTCPERPLAEHGTAPSPALGRVARTGAP
jgi:glycosyltransferase involved in cell wall biosynthesis